MKGSVRRFAALALLVAQFVPEASAAEKCPVQQPGEYVKNAKAIFIGKFIRYERIEGTQGAMFFVESQKDVFRGVLEKDRQSIWVVTEAVSGYRFRKDQVYIVVLQHSTKGVSYEIRPCSGTALVGSPEGVQRLEEAKKLPPTKEERF